MHHEEHGDQLRYPLQGQKNQRLLSSLRRTGKVTIMKEAIPEGMEAALTFDDPLIGAYRIHCQAYKRGYSVREIVSEMLGKNTGATKGKGGSMHYYKK